MQGASPLGNSGSVGAKGGVVNFMDEDTEEGGSLLTRVGLELRLDIDDERGSDRREQTGLVHLLERARRNFIRNSQKSKSYSNPHRTSS